MQKKNKKDLILAKARLEGIYELEKSIDRWNYGGQKEGNGI